MRTKVFFCAGSGTWYELEVEHDPMLEMTTMIVECDDGTIQDIIGTGCWPSLAAMTQDLKCEIIDWGSEVGN